VHALAWRREATRNTHNTITLSSGQSTWALLSFSAPSFETGRFSGLCEACEQSSLDMCFYYPSPYHLFVRASVSTELSRKPRNRGGTGRVWEGRKRKRTVRGRAIQAI